jgi:AmiR/NasT family two-component response regulator
MPASSQVKQAEQLKREIANLKAILEERQR